MNELGMPLGIHIGMYMGIYMAFYTLFLFWLASRFVGTGSDHYFAFYHIDLMRKSGGFIRNYPNILNETATVDTQLTFKILSLFHRSVLKAVSLWLNPMVMLLLFSLFMVVALGDGRAHGLMADSPWILLAMVIVTLTPQYFMGHNARIYGLTMRGLGLLSVMGLALSVYASRSSPTFMGMATFFHPLYFSLAILSVYLTWHINLFAQQTMIVMGLLMGLIFGEWQWAAAVMAGTAVFVLLEPAYAFFFFRMRWEYLIIFYKYLSAKLIWDKRASVWRDLVRDFWHRNGKSWRQHFYYIYTNPIVAVLVCNPLLWVGLLRPPTLLALSPLLLYSYRLGVVSLIAMVLTSFRKTRCLGEPERYVEMTIPFTGLVGAASLYEWGGISTLYAVVALFVGMNAIQIFMFVKMARYSKASSNKNIFNFPRQISRIVQRLEMTAGGQEIRFISNNGDWTKMLVNDRWKFVLFYPSVRQIAGVSIQDFLKTFPLFEKKHLEHFIEHYRLNYCLLYKAEYSSIFEGDPTKVVEILDETEAYVLLRIRHLHSEEGTMPPIKGQELQAESA